MNPFEEDTLPIPLEFKNQMISQFDFSRLEKKVDQVANALNKLVVVEERQSNQNLRITELEKAVAVVETKQEITDQKVEKWIQRGVGIWATAATLWILYEFAVSHNLIKLGP